MLVEHELVVVVVVVSLTSVWGSRKATLRESLQSDMAFLFLFLSSSACLAIFLLASDQLRANSNGLTQTRQFQLSSYVVLPGYQNWLTESLTHSSNWHQFKKQLAGQYVWRLNNCTYRYWSSYWSCWQNSCQFMSNVLGWVVVVEIWAMKLTRALSSKSELELELELEPRKQEQPWEVESNNGTSEPGWPRNHNWISRWWRSIIGKRVEFELGLSILSFWWSKPVRSVKAVLWLKVKLLVWIYVYITIYSGARYTSSSLFLAARCWHLNCVWLSMQMGSCFWHATLELHWCSRI